VSSARPHSTIQRGYAVRHICPEGTRAAPLVNRANLVGKQVIALASYRCRALSPRIVAAAGDAKHAAQQGDGMIGLLRLNEREHR